MLFSSISFLYYFLPLLLLIYFIVPSKWKNIVLLIFSFLFYFYGEQQYILILLLSCLMNYIFGLWVEKGKHKKGILWFAIVSNLGLLIYFKYADFLIANLNQIFHLNISLFHVIMPIGISFFTFQTLSYVVDVYWGNVKANHNFLEFATYVTLFPQLVAGPIVRYSDVEKELKKRQHSFSNFSKGISRFTIGLSKKIFIANVVGELASILLQVSNPSVAGYIVITLCYTIQIYFDFSGYSDMAIGLGNMFGFHFLENFNYPLISKSITEFWRRWHMSLSSWFKDYIYIPLGGNRVSKIKWLRNILVVWLLTGFWHGAAWNFILWGLYFAILLILEKMFFADFLKKHPIFGHIYTLIFVLISFVIFNVSSCHEIMIFLKNLFGLNGLPLVTTETLYYIRSYGIILIVSCIAATPILKNVIQILKTKKGIQNIINGLEPVYYMILLLLATAFLIDSSFNPFLYFRF